MSLPAVRTFFRTRLEGLGFTEHRDAFNIENIGSNIMDDTFHIESGVITTSAANQRAHNFDYPVTVRVFKKGFVDPIDLNDALDQTIEDILSDVLLPANRLGGAIKDVVPDSFSRIPLDATNDNVIILEMNFTCKIVLCF